MPILTLNLNDAEAEKLAQLARARGKTPEACIKDFLAACQPGGWTSALAPKPPEKTP